jgi:hypothetical protein
MPSARLHLLSKLQGKQEKVPKGITLFSKELGRGM